MQYIFSFLRNDVISPEKTPSLKEQLSAHLLDITTYREADLCDSSCITEKVFVSTVHKAKGLEFENVIIFEATDGVYPFFDKKTPEEIRESARLFYVAMTRAKIRLHIHIRGISVRNLQIGKPLLYRQGTYPIPPPHKEILSFIFNVSYIPIIIFNSKFEWSFIRNVLFKQLSNKTHIKLFKGHPFTIGLLIFTNYIISVF